MIKKHKNKGFSLLELIVAITILAIITACLIPSYIHLSKEAKIKKDITKFDSVCVAFKSALSEPEVKKEMKQISEGETVTVICHIDSDGLIVFGDGKVIGVQTKKLNDTELWLNSYQSVDSIYIVENKEFYNKYIVFTVVPKQSNDTAECEYEIVDNHPLVGEGEF